MTLASFCISPAVCVFCGTRVAPSHRFVTAIVLTVLWAITVTALFTWSATARGYDDWFRTGKSLTWAVLGVISTLVTSFIIYQTEQEARQIEELLNKKKATDSKAGGPQPTEDPPRVYHPFATLGVRPDASFNEIRQAYRERMKEYHPDRVASLGAELRTLAERKAKEINMVFEDLKKRYGVA